MSAPEGYSLPSECLSEVMIQINRRLFDTGMITQSVYLQAREWIVCSADQHQQPSRKETQ